MVPTATPKEMTETEAADLAGLSVEHVRDDLTTGDLLDLTPASVQSWAAAQIAVQTNSAAYHPGWCRPGEHENDEDGHECHERFVAGGFIPEIRRAPREGAPTRVYGGGWEIYIEQRVQAAVHDLVKDPTVRLQFTQPPPIYGVELLAGEAREIATALIHAADLMLFEREQR